MTRSAILLIGLTLQQSFNDQGILYEILISHRPPYQLDMARRPLNFLWFICGHLAGGIIMEDVIVKPK